MYLNIKHLTVEFGLESTLFTLLSNMQSRIEKILDSMLREEVKRLNFNLPKRKATLEDLLKNPDLKIETVGKSEIYFRKKDVDALGEVVPKNCTDLFTFLS